MTDENIYSAPEADLNNPNAVEVDDTPTRGLRFAGALIDGLIASLIFFPIMFFGGFWESAVDGSSGIGSLLILLVIGIVVFLALHGYLLINHGQTIAKKILGMKIVSVETGEIPPTMNLIGLRYLVFHVVASIPLIGSFIPLVDALFIFQKDKRCLHDMLAGTRVIKIQ